MWRELINLWKSDNLLKLAWQQCYEMLESASTMYKASVKSLRGSDKGELGFDVYEKDKVLNRFMQEVRQKVLKHLAITGTIHLSPGLVLISIVIDIERIGDFTKNIMDLAKSHPKKLLCGKFEQDICKIETTVAELFDRVISALQLSDKDEAENLIKENWWLIKKCDEIADSLVREGDDSLSTSNAVSTALYIRYLKRTTAHLMNVTSSIINPFERIGYHTEAD